MKVQYNILAVIAKVLRVTDEDLLSEMRNMTHTLSLSVFIAFKGTNFHILLSIKYKRIAYMDESLNKAVHKIYSLMSRIGLLLLQFCTYTHVNLQSFNWLLPRTQWKL